MTRRCLFALLSLATLELIGCQQQRSSGPVGATKDDREYYLLAISTANPYWVDAKAGFEDRGRQLGVKAIFTGPQDLDAAAQARQLDEIVAKKPAGIIVVPADPAALKPGIDRAIDAGIPVLCQDTDSPQSKRMCFIGTANYESGLVVGRLLGEAIGGKGNVGVSRLLGQDNINERFRGVKDALAKFPGIQIVGDADDKGDQEESAKANSAMLTAHPDLAGVVGLDAASGSGIARAVIERNLKGKVKIVSFDRNDDMLNYIEDGTIEASVAQKSYLMAWTGLTYLHSLANNLAPHLPDWKAAKAPPVPNTVDTGTMVITKANVAQFRHKK